jgi:hypothetical protein
LNLRVAGYNRFTIDLTAIDHDPLWPAMPRERLAQEAFGSGEVSPLAEPKLDGVAIAVQVWELEEQLLQGSC